MIHAPVTQHHLERLRSHDDLSNLTSPPSCLPADSVRERTITTLSKHMDADRTFTTLSEHYIETILLETVRQCLTQHCTTASNAMAQLLRSSCTCRQFREAVASSSLWDATHEARWGQRPSDDLLRCTSNLRHVCPAARLFFERCFQELQNGREMPRAGALRQTSLLPTCAPHLDQSQLRNLQASPGAKWYTENPDENRGDFSHCIVSSHITGGWVFKSAMVRSAATHTLVLELPHQQHVAATPFGPLKMSFNGCFFEPDSHDVLVASYTYDSHSINSSSLIMLLRFNLTEITLDRETPIPACNSLAVGSPKFVFPACETSTLCSSIDNTTTYVLGKYFNLASYLWQSNTHEAKADQSVHNAPMHNSNAPTLRLRRECSDEWRSPATLEEPQWPLNALADVTV